MKRYLRFLGVGSLFATVEEFLTIVILKHDVGSHVFTLLVLFPVFLTFVHGSAALLDRVSPTEPHRELMHFVAYGVVGLMIEWFLIGLAPWSNPAANPLLMLMFQAGMFSFRAAVAFVPRLFLSADETSRRARRVIARSYGTYFGCVSLIGVAVPEQFRFATIIPLVIAGYLNLDVIYVRYFLRRFAEQAVGPSPPT